MSNNLLWKVKYREPVERALDRLQFRQDQFFFAVVQPDLIRMYDCSVMWQWLRKTEFTYLTRSPVSVMHKALDNRENMLNNKKCLFVCRNLSFNFLRFFLFFFKCIIPLYLREHRVQLVVLEEEPVDHLEEVKI